MEASLTVEALVARAMTALEQLERRGLEIEDEWQYVDDLARAWRSRLETVVAERGPEVVGPEVVLAVATASEEAELVADPHRAIDWLSTLPQIVLGALGAAA